VLAMEVTDAEEAAAVAQDKVQLAFARKLAHNDLKVRNKAVKRLRLWLSKRGDDNTETDLLKLWKGLFYCMWMSDKALIQEELAKRLAGITMCFSDDAAAMNYIKAFYTTMTREWQGIDRLRLDKFYHLIAEFLGQGFLRVKRAGWQSEAAEVYANLLIEGPLNTVDSSHPLGIALQMCDTVVETLADQGVETAEEGMSLLAPFWNILLTDYRRVLTERVETGVIGKLMTMEAEAQPQASALPVDWEKLAETLFEGAANPETPIKKREELYKIRKVVLKHRKQMAKATVAAAAAAETEGAAAAVDGADADAEEQQAAEAMEVKAASKATEKSKKKKRKRADPVVAEPPAPASEDEAASTEESPVPARSTSKRVAASAKKGKKKKGAAAAEAVVAEEKVIEEAPVSAKKAKKAKTAKPQPKAVAALAAEPDVDHGSPVRSGTPGRQLKSALGTPQDFLTPRRSSRLQTRRISWGDNEIRRFKKKLPPASVSAEKSKKSNGPY